MRDLQPISAQVDTYTTSGIHLLANIHQSGHSRKMILRLQKLTSMNFCTEDLVVRAFSITFPDVL